MRWWKASLAELSDGNGWRAAAILVVAHLAPALVLVGLWTFGMLGVFDGMRTVLGIVAVLFAVASLLGLFVRFGFWGTPSTLGQSGGEDLEATFEPRVGFGLGWLRWFMQIVAAFAMLAPTLLIIGNVRWWHFTGTPELDGLASRAATMPIPDDWTLIRTEASATGFPQFMDGPTGSAPEGFVEKTFTVPDAFGFDDLKAWLASPRWVDNPDAEAFGAIRRIRCETASASCRAHLIPPPGEQAAYLIRADLDERDAGADQVVIRLRYKAPVHEDYDVSDATLDRASQLPIPREWTRYSVVEGPNANGDSFTQFFEVPEDFDDGDLRAWFTGSSWTSGPDPFGALSIDADTCWETGTGSTNPKLLCSAIVEGTQRDPATGSPGSGPIESVRASLGADHSVQVNLSRNG